MPCNDVTELIEVAVNSADQLERYRFIKRTCGQGVGSDALVLDQLRGRPVEDILAIEPQAFLGTVIIAEPIEEFLYLKHLIAVQSALEVLTGKAAGGPGAICAAAEISFDEGATTLHARIAVDLMTEKIKSCGGCKGCGKPKRRKKLVLN